MTTMHKGHLHTIAAVADALLAALVASFFPLAAFLLRSFFALFLSFL